MDHAIPSPVTVLDMDSDGYADRMYVGDMAAQVWRFDIWNGQSAASLVTGGVIASLGAKDESARTAANTRRFYNAPDVAAVQTPGIPPYLNIGLGSGYRGHPLETATQDAFYALRDYVPFAKLTQAQYNSYATIVDAHASTTLTTSAKLLDITSQASPTIPAGAAGWQILMNQHGGWVGEKVLAASRTFDQKILFTTYTPNTGAEKSNPCAGVGTGTNRIYAVSVTDGAPLLDQNKDGVQTTDERSADLSQGGIAPESAFLFLEHEDSGGDGGSGDGGGSGTSEVVCLSGVEVLSVCSNFNQRRKTYWREGGAN
jgi:type IV pilus assembly protein PilY1